MWIDEVHEMIGAMCQLRQKSEGSGKWMVWKKLLHIISTSKRTLFTSAQADARVECLFNETGIQPHWQMNEQPLLAHLSYRIIHYDSPEVGYQIILDSIRDGNNCVIACAEQKDLTSLEMYLFKEFPGLQLRKVDRTVSGTAREEILTELNETVFQVIMFTASLDCGFSINIQGYDHTFLRLNVRSINPTQALQMTQRVRSISSNTITILCEAGVKDWDRNPGYRTERLPPDTEMPAATVRGGKLSDMHEQLKSSTVELAYFMNNQGLKFTFTRKVPPHQVTFDEAYKALMYPASLRVVADENTAEMTVSDMMTAADVSMMKLAADGDLIGYQGLIRLMTMVQQDDMNKSRDMLANILRFITLQ